MIEPAQMINYDTLFLKIYLRVSQNGEFPYFFLNKLFWQKKNLYLNKFCSFL